MESHEKHHHGAIEYRFCPRCGGGLESRMIKSAEPNRLVCRNCAFIFYLDPKVVAGTLFSINGGLVLLRRGIEPGLGKWSFPGGHVDRGESVQEAAIRETQEEAHLDVRLKSLLGVYSYPRSPNVVVVYTAEVVGGELTAGDEAVEAKAFEASKIPWQELAFMSTKDAVADFLKLQQGLKG